ncbi:MAG: ROK family protein [Bacteroidetes bacterium]|nr:ROK family protein [Bacteroidota bacterium]
MRNQNAHLILGIDVGGSGVKGAVVDVRKGTLVTDRYRLKTPGPGDPKSVAQVVARIVRHFVWRGPVGCGMPGPIKHGRIPVLSNLDKAWIGVDVAEVYSKACGCRVTVINDADAAGLAEMRFGAGKKRDGVVVLTTFGTGIGTAVFVDKRLVPNTEFGQMEINGKPAEVRASARVRKARDLSWKAWGERVNTYLLALENVLWPDLIIVGGGVSRKASRFLPRITTKAEVIPAKFRNEAGIVGAALAAASRDKP